MSGLECMYRGDRKRFLFPGVANRKVEVKFYTSAPSFTADTFFNFNAMSKYPNNPTIHDYSDDFVVQRDINENYVLVMTSYLIAPATGNYYFALACDDACVMYLGDERNLIIQSLNSNELMDYTGQPNQVSSHHYLTKGEKYYIEVVLRENTQADRMSLSMKIPGEPDKWQLVTSRFLAPRY
ncbi:uncharacterized protein [Clytia hemisphaerica]|uniref:PA14 domain-containing protein n=1 Tax=Clytia hemisphaerica TaxID=252671 RepID=A0A7M5X7N7_9CNID